MHSRDNDVFEEFLARGIISSVEGVIKSGKEAEVYHCLPGPAIAAGTETGERRHSAVAVKVYKDIADRSFRAMSSYLDGRIGRSIRGRREILHMFASESSMQAYWVDAEFEALFLLSERGLPVPRPYFRTSKALAMELVAHEDGEAAPQLVRSKLPSERVAAIYDGLLEDLLDMLRLDLIHGDLSPYNILVRDGELVIIDFPQAIDARYHSQAGAMFARDLENVSRWFEHAGVQRAREAAELARKAWDLYERNRL